MNGNVVSLSKTSDEYGMILKFYLWVMGWSGAINAWAWRKQSRIKSRQQKENEEYLKELKKKL